MKNENLPEKEGFFSPLKNLRSEGRGHIFYNMLLIKRFYNKP